jgi:cell division protein FtsL
MAGRPVAARGGSGILYGLIAFVIVAVASLGGFVWQLTANRQLQDENESAVRKQKQYGTPPSYYVQEASARNSSVFGVMQNDLEELAFLVTGKREAVRPAIVEGANKLLQEIAADSPGTINPSDTVLTALWNLHGAYMDLRRKHTQLTADLQDLRNENRDLAVGVKRAQDEFAAQVAELKEEVARLAQERYEQLAAKDEQLANQLAEADALNEELGNLKKEQRTAGEFHDAEVQRLEKKISELETKVAELKPGGFDPYDILTKADGQVLRAIPGSDVIYINLGQADRIKPGMKFEVFSPIDPQRYGFRGKASVEVAAVMDTTAECRVTRMTPGRPILEEDIVVNIAYERDRLPKFVVLGEFDLNYDNQKEADGRDKVAAIIRAWGGRVVDQIDENTDFLVVGTGPQVPAPSGALPVSDVVRDLADSRLKELRQYEQSVDQAQRLYIPVITQTQFLFLTGYSERGPLLTE